MANSELDILVKVQDQATAALRQVTGGVASLSKTAAESSVTVGQFGSSIGQLGMGLTATVTAPIIGGLVLATKSAMDFNSQMLLIQTQAGASAKEVASMSQAVIGMAGSVAQTPQDLAKGLYMVESSGFRGAQALDIMKLAAEGATVGQSDLQSTTSALTSVMASHLKGVTDATSAMSQMNGIVGAGKMHMQDLVDAIGSGILPVASQLGVSFSDLGISIDTMTTKGVPAADAANRLKTALTLLAAPKGAALDALNSIGLSQFQLADDLRTKGLIPMLEDLQTKLKDSGKTADQQTAILSAAFGGIRGSAAIEALLNGLGEMPATLKTVSDGAKNFGTSITATLDDPATKAKAAQAQLQATLITIGQTVLPMVAQAMTVISAEAQKLSAWWNALSPQSQELVLKIALLAATLGPLLMGISATIRVVEALSIAMSFMAANPIVFIIAAIAAAVIWFITMDNGIQKMEGTFNKFQQWLNSGSKLLSTITSDIRQFITWIDAVSAKIENSVFGKLVIGATSSIANGITSLMSTLHVPGFADGITNFSGGLALVGERGPELVQLPSGSSVIPNNKMGGGQSISVNIYGGVSTANGPQDIENMAQKIGKILQNASHGI